MRLLDVNKMRDKVSKFLLPSFHQKFKTEKFIYQLWLVEKPYYLE